MIEPTGRGVLDAPVKPGHDSGVRRCMGRTRTLQPCHPAPVLPDGSTKIPTSRIRILPIVSTVHGVVFTISVADGRRGIADADE
ncbi:hypothetical protein [Bradyrhizobium guangdongense]